MSDTDVVVVGAGPSGSAAAITLAQAGLKVTLIDRASFPREKVCGDAVAYSCTTTLRGLGIGDDVEAHKVFSSDRMRLQLSDGTDAWAQTRQDQPFAKLVPRTTLDGLLVDRARSYDRVRVLEGCHVESISRRESGMIALELQGRRSGGIRTPIVIIAAGGATKLGVGPSWKDEPRVLAYRGYFDDVDGLSDAVEFITHERVLPGYFWIFPTGARSANIGVASYAPHARLRDELVWFLSEHPRGRALGSLRQRGRLRGGVIPVLASVASRVTDGALLCGDAGRFCDPLTFHGIGPALWSGVLAASVACRALHEGHTDAAFLAEYDRLWKAQFGVNALFLGMSLFEGVNPMNALEESAPNGSFIPARLREDAGRRYELLLRAFTKIN
jgi:menaquinone-9 beta-reductase